MAALLLLAVWLSGAAALIAEVVWFRGLGRGVGTSAEALAVVSAAFLGGLGIGAALASRRAPTAKFPLRSAARCEGIAGILVFLSPFAISMVPGAHLALLNALHLEPGRSSWPAALVALPVLLLPTAFLGATLPFLVRSVVTHGVTRAGRWTGYLYGVNTIGALCGTGAAVLYLLPHVGEVLSLRVASGCNLLAAALILLAERPSDVEPVASLTAPDEAVEALPDAPKTPEAPPPPPLPVPSPGGRRVSIPEWTLFASGLFALGGEVAWFRLLEPLTGIHLYGFAILLGGVLLGTAVGGALGGIVADRVKRPDLALSTVLTAAGLLTLGSIWAAGWVPWLAMRSATLAGESARAASASAGDVTSAIYHALFRTRLAVAALCVAPPLAAYAMAYPLAVRVRATDPARAAAAAGSTYAWNTAGNMLGSLLAGFLLLPAVGGPRTLAIFGGLALATAVGIRLAAGRPRRVWPAFVPLAGLALLALPHAAEQIDLAGPTLPEAVALDRFTESLHVHSRADARAFAERMGGTYPRPAGRPDAPPITPREGVVSSVGVLQEGRYVRLRQGALSESRFQPNDPDAGSETEVALAAVPYLAHPHPKKALGIGHGAGWTVETLLSTPIPRVDVAELESAVLDVVEAYRGPLLVRSAPNAHLHVTDGRLMLRLAAAKPEGERYDIIVSQPSHPWVPGAGHLFTREAYQLARSALNRDGIFSQWLNVFSMTRELLQTALKAWHDVFPDCWVMRYYDELVLVGFTGPSTIDVARWTSELTSGTIGVRARAAGIDEPADLVRHIALDGEGLARILPLDFPPAATDDDPRLELGLAWARFAGVDDDVRDREKNAIYADIQSSFPPHFEKIVPNPKERDALMASVVWGLLGSNQTEEARRWLRGGGPVAFDGGVLGKRARAKESLLTGRSSSTDASQKADLLRRGVELLRAAVLEAPADAAPAVELGEALLDQGRSEEAAQALTDAAKRHPDDGRILALLGRALIATDHQPAAEDAFRRALAAKSPRAPSGTGSMLARALETAEPRRPADARKALRDDAATFSDLDALERLRALEIEIGTPGVVGLPPAVKEIDDTIASLERRRGHEKLETALAWFSSNTKDALEQAREATNLLPTEPAAWRVRGWLELRSKDIAAAASFRKSLSLEKPEHRETARADIVAWYRLHDRDPAELDRNVPEEPK